MNKTRIRARLNVLALHFLERNQNAEG
jgi:hypothetical protein